MSSEQEQIKKWEEQAKKEFEKLPKKKQKLLIEEREKMAKWQEEWENQPDNTVWNPNHKTFKSLWISIGMGLNKAKGCDNTLRFTNAFCERYNINPAAFLDWHHQGCDCEMLMNIKDGMAPPEPEEEI